MHPSRAHPQRSSTTRGAVLACAAGALLLTGCAGSQEDGASNPDAISVVTSTTVYADLVRQVGGDAVAVTAVVGSPAQDPHSYEASPRDRLAVEKADLVVRNGGGYDAFMDGLITDSQPVVDAVDASGLRRDTGQTAEPEHAADETGHEGHAHEPGGFNEHVWYDLAAVRTVTDDIAAHLGELDRDNARTYTDHAATLGKELAALEKQLSSVKATGGYVATEPVPDYLLSAAGLHNETPAEFTSAVDAEADVAPAVLKDTTDLITDGHVDLLAFNQQTATGQSERLRLAAEAKGVPVVEFSESLPDGTSYQDWMRRNVENVSRAVGN